jgi:drug/metabolite transporter (DMT)-like permease
MEKYILFGIISGIGFGISPIFDTETLKYYSYDLVYCIRILLYTLLVILYLVCTSFYEKYNGGKNKKDLNGKLCNLLDLDLSSKEFKYTLKYCFGSGIFSGLIGGLFYFKSLQTSKSNNSKGSIITVVLLSYILPIFVTTIISYLFLNEKINIGMVGGIILSIIGICIFIFYKKNGV